MGKITESIYDGTVVVPLADVSHVIKHSLGIQIITRHTTYNSEIDDYNNCVWISKEEQQSFLSTWCRYRGEYENI